MSSILVFSESSPAPLEQAKDHAEIAAILSRIGVRFEVWTASRELSPGASRDEILEAYAEDVARIRREGGFVEVDVARIAKPAAPDASWPEKAKAAREKFRDEHTHAEDEVRFFVEGAGIFYLRGSDEKIYAVVCERGDFIALPAGIRHWFDMGEEPSFCAIRFFRTPEGWVASFTGDPIARRFPDDAQIRGFFA